MKVKLPKYNHKILRFTVLILMFLSISVSLARSNSPAPVEAAELKGQFECLPAFYQTIGLFGPVDFKRLKLKAGEERWIYEPIGSTGNDLTNAIAYNVKDDFIYGSIKVGGDTRIARIDNTGNATNIGDLKGDNIVAADIDKDGIYTYIQGANLLGRYDIASGAPLPDVSLNGDLGGSGGVGDLQDVVFRGVTNPSGLIEQRLYGISGTRSELVEINVSTGLVKRAKLFDAKGTKTPIKTGSPYGAGWAALENKLYFSRNQSGEIYQIVGFGTDTPTYEEPKPAEPTTGNDGASCPNAPDPFDYYNRPFLRVSGGDVRSGADFGGGDGFPNCTADDPARNALDAPIITNGYYSSDDSAPAKYWGSSSGQYGVFASGDIGNQDTNTDNELDNNFYGNNFYIREKNKDLMFSNNDSSQYGRFYSGGPGVPCIDISVLVNGATSTTNTFTDFTQSTPPNRTRKKFKSQTVDSTINVGGRSKIAVIDGNLTINKDIRYSSTGYGSLTEMPNLVVIVLGDINISNDVGQLDGTYIAYPAADGSGGVIRTCSEAAGVKLAYSTCSRKLTINGRLLAKKVDWKRTWGTVGKKTSLALGIDTCNAVSSNSSELMLNAESCAAEFINFSPEAFFNTSTSTVTGEVGNVPLSTVDLPPIY